LELGEEVMPVNISLKASPIDVDFILNKLEGTVRKDDKYIGHVPKEGSGITIANGLDLGFQNKESLLKLGLDEKLIKTLSPYLGKVSNKDNINSLKKEAEQLSISNKDAEKINKGILKEYTDKTKNQYNNFFNYVSKVTGTTMPEKKGLVNYQPNFDKLSTKNKTLLVQHTINYGHLFQPETNNITGESLISSIAENNNQKIKDTITRYDYNTDRKAKLLNYLEDLY